MAISWDVNHRPWQSSAVLSLSFAFIFDLLLFLFGLMGVPTQTLMPSHPPARQDDNSISCFVFTTRLKLPAHPKTPPPAISIFRDFLPIYKENPQYFLPPHTKIVIKLFY
jgi:hypothetical protein